jgi:hypothetical protein
VASEAGAVGTEFPAHPQAAQAEVRGKWVRGYLSIPMWEGGGHIREDRITKSRKKISRVFLLAVPSHLYSFSLRFISLETHATSYVFLQFSYCTQ